MFGVTPSGLAESGASLTEAHLVFLNALRKVLFDIANEVPSFEEFQTRVHSFFEETNTPTAADWEKAVEEVRAGKVNLEGLPRASTDNKPMLSVGLMQASFSPAGNKIDDAPQLAAA